MWELPKTRQQLEEDADRGKVVRLFDSVFKYVFCKEERSPIFLDLVNAIVFPNGERQFTKVRFIDREKSPDRLGGKGGRFDSLALLDDGDLANVEMQASFTPDFEKRSVAYTSWVHAGQLDRGKKYHETSRTISIDILGYDHFKRSKNFRRSFSFRDDETGEQLNDDMRIIFLEIPRFIRTVKTPRNKLERWMKYFAGTGGEEMEQIAQQEPKISDALVAEKFFSMDKEKRYAYFLEWKQIIDEESRLAWAEASGEARGKAIGKAIGEAQGEARGRAIGEAQGEANCQIKIARSMIEEGMDMELAAKCTGLSLKEVKALRNKA
jgi:predicted transposase/invertase (TIGR01784 family)